MSMRADILEIARIFSDASRSKSLARFQTPGPVGKDAKVYAGLMPALAGHPDVPGALRPAAFRPFFVVNGLLLATSLPAKPRSVLLACLATGLLEFADYFETLHQAQQPALSSERALKQQARYFAFCLARLVDCGMPLTGVFATMKGDAFDQKAALELRRWIEEGPKAVLDSTLIDEEERALWRDVFARKRPAWPALRERLNAKYSLPIV